MSKTLLFKLIPCLFSLSFFGAVQAQIDSSQFFLKVRAEYYYSSNFSATDSLQRMRENGIIDGFEATFRLEDEVLKTIFTLHIGHVEKWEQTLALQNLPWIEYMEPVPVYSFYHTPNDLNTRQWAHTKVQSDLAWDDNKGDPAITIAIVDDAVLLSHEDLQSAIWVNPNEIAGNGIDDDGNGYIDDVNGWDAADNDNNPNPPANRVTSSFFTHGTHCAGIAGARTNNGLGVASLGYNVSIIPVKVLENNTLTRVITKGYLGVEYAIAANARVINMSFGGSIQSKTYQSLFNLAYRKGIICVAGAGNNNSDAPMFPANYDYVISVGSTDENDVKSAGPSGSNFGAKTDIMAPGVNIWSSIATGTGQYGYISGTSQSCAMVSSLAALMLSKDPLMSPDQVEYCIKSNADPIDQFNPAYPGNLGWGRINAFRTLRCVKYVYAQYTSDMVYVCPGGQVQYFDQSLRNPTAWEWEFQGGNPATSTAQNPVVTYPTAGIYDVKLKASNAKGTDSIYGSITVALPRAVLSGSYTIPTGYSVNLKLDLLGTGPWRVKLTNGTFSFWVENIQATPHYFTVTPQSSATYSIDTVFDSNCQGTSFGTATVSVVTFNSGNCTNATSTFQRHFKATGVEAIHSVIRCVDSGFAMIGTTTIGAGGTDLFLIRTNDTGAILWAKTIGSTSNEAGVSIKMTQTSDSGFAIAAETNGFSSAGYDVYFLKLTKTGTIQIQKKIGAAGVDRGRGIVQTADGGYLIGGTSGASPKSGAEDAYLIRLDASGNAVWTNKFGFSSTSTTHFVSAQALASGNIWFIGHGDHFVNPYLGFLAKVSPSGTIMNEYRYYASTTAFSAPIASATLADGNIVVVGVNSTDGGNNFSIEVFEMDTSGSVIWAKKVGNNSTTRPTGVTGTKDSGFVVTGYSNGVGGGNEIINVKFNKNGDVIWSRKYGSSGSELQDNWSACITESDDGGLVFGLHTNGFGSTSQDLMLVKGNECGFTGGCNEGSVTFTITNLTLTRTASTANKNQGGNNANVTSTVQAWTNITDTSNKCPNNVITVPGCQLNGDFIIQSRCAGEPTRFINASEDNSSSDPVYYKWKFTATDSVEGLPHPVFSFQQPGDYQVTLIVGNNGSPACYDTITKTVSIYDSIHVEIIMEDTVCASDSFNVSISSLVCSSGQVSYLWFPHSIFNDSSDNAPRASLQTSAWIKAKVTDSLGKVSEDSMFVFVDGNCCKSFANWESPQPVVCLGDPVNFINQSVAKPGAQYSWRFGPNASMAQYTGNTPPPIFYNSEGSFDVSLIVQDFCGLDTFEQKVYVLPLPQALVVSDTILCAADSLPLGGSMIGSLLYEWSPGYLMSDSNGANPDAWVDQTRNFYLKVIDTWSGCGNRDSVNAAMEDLDTLFKGIDTSLCEPNQLSLDYTYPNVSVQWYDGSTNPQRTFGASGIYWVNLRRNGCTSRDTNTVNLISTNLDILGPDFLCNTDTGIYRVPRDYSSIIWSTGSTDTFTWFSSEGYLKVTISEGACVVSDSLDIERFDTFPEINGDSVVCQGDSLELWVGNVSGALIQWENGSNDSSIWVKNSALYRVSYQRNGCILSDSIQVFAMQPPIVSLGDDRDLCEGDTLSLIVPNQVNTEIMWNTGETDSFLHVNSAGSYSVSLSNLCGIWVDSVQISFIDCNCITYVPNSFTPNGDGLNDLFGPSFCPVTNYSMIVFDRWGEIIFESYNITVMWDGTYKGIPVQEDVYGYMVNFSYAFGGKYANKGNVTVLRPKK